MRKQLLFVLLIGFCFSGPAIADLYLVKTGDGPGFTSPDEVAEVLEKGIIPLFDALEEMQAKKKIVAGGLPAGSRTLVFIVEADTHDEVDRMLRDLPAWGVFSWKVVPLQSIGGRADMERKILDSMK